MRGWHFRLLWLWMGFARRPRRMAVALVMIAATSALVFASFHFTSEIRNQMTREIQAVGPNLEIQPIPQEAPLPEAALEETLKGLPAGKSPLARCGVLWASAQTSQGNLPVMGVEWHGSHEIFPHWHVEGEWPHVDFDSKRVLLGQDAARRLGLTKGDTLEIFGKDERSFSYKVSGVLTTGDPSDSAIIASLSEAQEISQMSGQLSYAYVKIPVGSDTMSTRSDLEKLSRSHVRVSLLSRVSSREDDMLSKVERMMFFLTYALWGLCLVAVFSTFSALTHERISEAALSASLGAHPLEFPFQILAEGLVVGVTGGVAGLLPGWILSQFFAWTLFGTLVPWGFAPCFLALASSALSGTAASLGTLLSSGLSFPLQHLRRLE